MINRSLSTKLLTAFALTLSLSTAQAAEKLKFAHIYEPSEPYHERALWAAEQIKERTEGRYEVSVYPASSLGTESGINEGLSFGTVDIIYTSPIFASLAYGPIAISEAPYMFKDFRHWDNYTNSALFKDLSEGYNQATGNKILAIGYYGQRHVTANKEIKKPQDMENLKIRVPNAPLFLMFPNAVGANATPLAFSEVYLALQQGVIDAQENPLQTIRAKKFYEVQSDINLTAHITNSMLTIMSGNKWNSMSVTDRKVFEEVFAEAAEKYSTDIRSSEEELVSWFEKEGINVNEADRKAFRNAVAPLLNGENATWTKEQYNQLQSLSE